MLLNNILNRKINWVLHILRKKILFHDVIDDDRSKLRRKKNNTVP
jgi:hypothetical protein